MALVVLLIFSLEFAYFSQLTCSFCYPPEIRFGKAGNTAFGHIALVSEVPEDQAILQKEEGDQGRIGVRMTVGESGDGGQNWC